MKQHTFEPVTDPEVLRQAMDMMAIGNVAVHRAQTTNRALGIPNYYSIGGRVVSDTDINISQVTETKVD
ncbi:MAG: hypothetical protein KGZ88_04075 [Methylomicrobium sp.]|nr:hypothetical protein [Methylomicrobium sp.]